MVYDVEIDGRQYRVELVRGDASSAGQSWQGRVFNPAAIGARVDVGAARVDAGDSPANASQPGVLAIDSTQPEPDALSLLIAGRSYEIERERVPRGGAENGEVHLVLRGRRYAAQVRDPRALRGRKRAAGLGGGPQQLVAPMPGKIIRVLAPAGATVAAGDGVVVIEAMKMQNEIKSPKAGVVRKLLASEGLAVNAGDVLAVVE